MQTMEKEAYKIFHFMERTFDMKLLNVVTDWIRDEKGTYWFIGLKSFKLREESYLHKTTKPSAFDRELLAINVNKKVHKSMNQLIITYSTLYEMQTPLSIIRTWKEQGRERCIQEDEKSARTSGIALDPGW